MIEGQELCRITASAAATALVTRFEPYPGAGRTVPVRVRCGAGGHYSGNRLVLGLDGDAVVLGYLGQWPVVQKFNTDVLDEIEYLGVGEDRLPVLRVHCRKCGRLGRFERPERVLELVAGALVARERTKASGPAGLTWPVGPNLRLG